MSNSPPSSPPQSYPQQPGGPPPGYYAPQPPPKKKHTLRNVLLALFLLFVLFVGGCFAVLGMAANEIDKSLTKELANDTPTVVSVGKEFTHDDYDAAAGWTVAREFGGATITGLRVTNTSADSRSALLTFTFYKGKENLGEVECSSNRLQSGESSKMDCFSSDSGFPKGYTEVKVADLF